MKIHSLHSINSFSLSILMDIVSAAVVKTYSCIAGLAATIIIRRFWQTAPWLSSRSSVPHGNIRVGGSVPCWGTSPCRIGPRGSSVIRGGHREWRAGVGGGGILSFGDPPEGGVPPRNWSNEQFPGVPPKIMVFGPPPPDWGYPPQGGYPPSRGGYPRKSRFWPP